MPIACISIPNFSLRIALLDRPELDGLPLVLTSEPNSRTSVVDCSPEAARRGVRPGMMLREVTGLCVEAIFIEPNPVREARAFDQMAQALETISPAVEMAEPGLCFIDLTGLHRHDPSIEAAATRLLQAVPAILRPRAGIAPGKFSASAAARKAQPGGFHLVAEPDLLPFLTGLPVGWLPVDLKLIRSLERLGLHTLGDIAVLPTSALQARFGPTGKRIWNLAHGYDDTIVTPRPRPSLISESLTLPAPSTSREMLMIGVRQLVQRAFGRPELEHRFVRQARLQVMIEDHRSWEREMTFREPVGCERVTEILAHRLQAIELPGAAESLTLILVDLVNETAKQESLPGLRSRRSSPLVAVAHQLKRRYGSSPLYQVVEVEPWSRIPERRHALITFDP